jgi:hypothetical protein
MQYHVSMPDMRPISYPFSTTKLPELPAPEKELELPAGIPSLIPKTPEPVRAPMPTPKPVAEIPPVVVPPPPKPSTPPHPVFVPPLKPVPPPPPAPKPIPSPVSRPLPIVMPTHAIETMPKKKKGSILGTVSLILLVLIIIIAILYVWGQNIANGH